MSSTDPEVNRFTSLYGLQSKRGALCASTGFLRCIGIGSRMLHEYLKDL